MIRSILISVLLLAAHQTLLAQSTIEVRIDPGVVKSTAETGRVLVILQKAGDTGGGRRRGGGEPRFGIGATSKFTSPYFGVDVDKFTPDKVAVFDDHATPFPVDKLSDVPAGEY